MYSFGGRTTLYKSGKFVLYSLLRGKKDDSKIPTMMQIGLGLDAKLQQIDSLKPTPKPESEIIKLTRVCVLGSSSRVGSTLSLMLKVSPLIDSLHLHDDNSSSFGIGLDLSHIDTSCKIEAFIGNDAVGHAVKGADVVVVCSPDEVQTDMTLESMFYMNAGRIADIASICAQVCPNATVAVMAQPVNCLVPLMHVIFKREKIEKPKVLGIPSLNIIRATTALSSVLCMDPQFTMVPALGGSSGDTIVPILSQAKHAITQLSLAGNEILFQELLAAAYYPCRQPDPPKRADQIVTVVEKSDRWILEQKGATEGATMAPAYSGARFILNMVRGMKQQPGQVVDVAYVRTRKVPGMKYCCVPVMFGVDGVMRQCVLSSVSEFERQCLMEAKDVLAPQIEMGEKFAEERISKTMPVSYL